MDSITMFEQRKTTLKGALTRFQKYLQKLKLDIPLNKDEIKGKLIKQDKEAAEFDKVITALICASEIETDKDVLYDETDAFHLAYQATRDNALRKLGVTVLDPFANTPCIPASSYTNIGIQQTQMGTRPVHLQAIPLPTFSGNVAQWPEFADLFKSLVKDNMQISNVEKLLHLKSCLTGEAAKAISNITAVEGNFEIAWTILQKQYENPKLLIETHVKSLFALPKVNEHHNSLRDHLNQFRTSCDILKSTKSLTIDNLLIQFSLIKFDEETREKWEEYSYNVKEPTYEEIIEFLNQRIHIKSAAAKNASKKQRDVEAFKGPSFSKHNMYTHFTASDKPEDKPKAQPCEFCADNHRIYKCPQFLQLTEIHRYNVVKERNWCLNCLSKGHALKNCKSLRNCFKCTKRHNTLLHREDSLPTHTTAPTHRYPALSPQLNMQPSTSTTINPPIGDKTFTNSYVDPSQPMQILLSTVMIGIRNREGTLTQCRALLDNGSQPNIITSRMVDFLRLKYTPHNTHLAGIGTAATATKGYVMLNLCSNYNNYNVPIWATIVHTITQGMPSQTIDRAMLQLPPGVFLADPTFDTPGPIDLIIGAELFYELLCNGNYTKANGPTLQETQFGWVISGRVPMQYPLYQASFHVRTNDPLDNQLRKFWEIENVDISLVNNLNDFCETHFCETVSRDDTGRFVVKLPFNPLKDELGHNHETAVRRLCAIENRLHRNPTLNEAYILFMKEYKELGHMSKCEATSKGYFIPHHSVLKETSLTTKFRCVFDASASSSTGISLNDTLYVGPSIQDDLMTILLRFRSHPVVFTADIEKMYRQIRVSDEDRAHQRILWRALPTAPIEYYTLNTVTYGTACAPFLATRCLKELAVQEEEIFPRAANILSHDFYVDDCISGCNTANDAIALKSELVNLLSTAGFPLKKWRSNVPELMGDEPINAYPLNKSTMNTLGLSWNHREDYLLYLPSASPTQHSRVTKRIVLSEIARLFDPLGLIGPVILKAKLLLQRLWKLNLNWDQELPADNYKEWCDYRSEISKLVLITIPRCIFQYSYTRLELHGFSDASTQAYGCCVYIRASSSLNVPTTRLLAAKSRVAPVKTDTESEATLPRLELCGALLLAQLINKVRNSMKMNFYKTFCWSDSTIVLGWLASPPQTYKPFVSNRVRDIQKLTVNCEWRHVRTNVNPADLISRGSNTIALNENQLWWCGPNFLELDESQWPQLQLIHPVHTRECKSTLCKSFVTVESLDITQRFSSLIKLVRVTAQCIRFAKNCRSRSHCFGPISASEFQDALNRLIQLEQGKAFASEMKQLRRGEPLSPSSRILSLNPFLDEEEIIRVGGRLSHAAIDSNHQHPIILPSHNDLTNLIINYEHLRNLHAGQQSVLASIRTRYWPLSGKSTVRRILRKCVRCCRVRPSPVQHIMGDLPLSRVTPARPFSSCGLDYCGPFSIVAHHRRGARTSKAYVAVFVCFSTKATHLELVGDMTTESCLNAVKRFIARRGIISHLYSDNGTNFIGCNNELRRIAQLLSVADAQNHIAALQINWHFNPPHSPHFGGLWEAAVKAAKHHLRRVAGQTLLTFEELSTILAQTEAVLNSRPLTPISNDINDLGALTPGHFLIGQPLTALPDSPLTEVPINRLSRWQRVQQINQHFWQRWQREYLSQLQQRTKWKRSFKPVSVGEMVLVREMNTPPLRWKLGRIIAVSVGTDNVPRVARVRTRNGEETIATNRLCLLPIDNN